MKQFVIFAVAAIVVLVAGLAVSYSAARAQTSDVFTVELEFRDTNNISEDAGRTAIEVEVKFEGTTLPNQTTTVSLGHRYGTAGSSDYTFEGATVRVPSPHFKNPNSTRKTGTVYVTPRNDSIVEPEETFEIVARIGGVEKAATEFTINTDHNDVAYISFSGPTGKVSEGGNARFTVTVSQAVSEEFSVRYQHNSDDLGDGSFILTSGSVAFSANSGANSRRYFDVPIFDDKLSEPDEEHQVSLVSVQISGGSVLIPQADQRASVTIRESDPITVNLSGPAGGNVAEGSEAQFTVSMSPQGVIPSDKLTVEFATSDGTAISGDDDDYAGVTSSVEFPAYSSSTQTVSVRTHDNHVDESSRRFSAAISNPSGGGGPAPRLGSSSATATIIDNDDRPTGITLSATKSGSAATVAEGNEAEFTITADLDAVAEDTWVTLDSDLTLNIRLSGGTARSSDYSVTESLARVTIEAGQTVGTGEVTIAATDDRVVEVSETIAVSGSARGFTVTPTHITITDNDTAKLNVSGPSEEVTEGSAAVFTVTLSTSTERVDRAVAMEWSADDDNWQASAAASDFGPQNGASRSGVVTFPAGSAGGAARTFSVATQNDNLSEASETFFLALEPTGDLASSVSVSVSGGRPTDTTVSATIAESDPPVIRISGPSAHVEEGENAEFTVSLSGGVRTGEVSVVYATSDGTARGGSDYQSDTSTVTFSSWDTTTSQTVTVSTTDDTQDESSETFGVTIFNPSNLAGPTPVIATGSATATITDNDDPPTSVTLSAGDTASVTEGVQQEVTLTATLDGERRLRSDLELRIFIQSVGGGDFSITNPVRTLTIEAGEASGSGKFTLTAVDDEIVEGDEVLTLGGRADGFTVSTADITIEDNDSATVSVSGPSDEVSEGGSAVFTVTLSHSVDADITVALSADSGDAIAGSDFGAVPSVTFGAGSGARATRSARVSVTDDNISEGAEDFGVTLGAISGDLASLVSISGENKAAATIAANDPITVNLSGPASVDEGEETAAYTVSLSGGIPSESLTVDFATADGTAKAGSDYTANSSGRTFSSTDFADKTFSVQTKNDTVKEGDETFTVSLLGASGGGGPAPILGASSVTTTIEDVSATLSLDAASVAEDASATNIAVTITLDGGRTFASDKEFSVSVVGDTAYSSSDYTASGTSVTIAAGESSGSGTLTITPTDDEIVEGSERIIVSGYADNIGVSSADITITDNDSATLSISGPSGEVAEGSNAVFTVTLSHSVAAEVTVALSAESGSATAGSDFGAVPATVAFGYLADAEASRSVSVAVMNDDLSEGAEDFSVRLGAVSVDLASLVSLKSGEDSASATIAASDSIMVSLSGPSVVDERGEAAVYTVSLSGGAPSDDLTVNYATSDGTATAGSDYTAKSGTLTFTPDDFDDKTFSVRTMPDTLTEGDESFSTAITGASGNGGQVTTMGTSSVTTMIEEVGMSLGVGTASLAESASSTAIVVTATLDEGDERSSDVTVDIVLGGEAGSGDYSASALSVTIDAGESSGSGTLTITPTDDEIVEGAETITVSGNSTGIAVSSTHITITDNDTATLSLSAPSGEATEGSDAVFTATLSHDVGSDVTVAWSSSSGSAIAGTDVSATGTVTFGSGGGAGATQPVRVAVTDDNFSEGAEDFSVSLGAVSGDLASRVSLKSGEDSASATIALNDRVTFNVSGPASVEEGETATYTISLSPPGVTPPAGASFVVDYATAAGTATQLNQQNRNFADYDWKASGHTFTADNPGSVEVSVETFDDSRVEEDETFRFWIAESWFSMGGNDSRLRPRFGTSAVWTTITDDDVVESDISLSVSPPAMAEDDDPMSFTVTATLNGGDPATADIPVTITLGGTATEGSDYTVDTALSSITIPANSSSATGTLALSPTDDEAVERDEVITLSGSATGLTVDSADITIDAQISDHAKVTISGPSGEVEEGSDAVFTATLSNLVSGEVTVEWHDHSIASSTAALSDYGSGDGKGSFTIPSNTLTHTFAIPINDDDLVEPAEIFYIEMRGISAAGFAPGTVGGGNPASATIAASDGITVNLSGPAAVVEGSETAAYTVSLSGGTPAANLRVDYATADGTAEEGSDYTAESGTLTFTPDDFADKTFSVRTMSDAVVEGGETFRVTLSNATGGGGGQTPALGASTATTTIRDVGISLSAGTASLSESATSTDIVITATLDDGVTLASSTEITLSLGGAASSAFDYTATGLGPITIAAGESSGSVTLTLTPTDDNYVEGDEAIRVSGSADDISVSPTVITITDNDTATVSISGPSQVEEGDSRTYAVSLSRPVAATITVGWEIRSGSAGADDYRCTAWCEGVVFNAEVYGAGVVIEILEDDLSEGDEDFSVVLGTISGKLAHLVSLKSGESSATTTIAANVATATPTPTPIATSTPTSTPIPTATPTPTPTATPTPTPTPTATPTPTPIPTPTATPTPTPTATPTPTPIPTATATPTPTATATPTPAPPPDDAVSEPGRPTNLAVATPAAGGNASSTVTFTLSWDAPSDGGAPSSYQILRRAPHTEASPSVLVEDTGSTDTTYADTMEINGAKFFNFVYRVKAVNARGLSWVSRPAEIFFRPEMPGRPTGLSAKVHASSGTSVVLTWDAPTDGSAPSGYQVLRRVATEPDFAALAEDTGSTDTTYTDTTVTPKTAYVYRVSAVNAHGVGERSEPADIFYRPVPPGRPTGLSAQLGDGGSSIVLSWDAPTDGSAPSGYQILRRAAKDANFTVVADDTGSTGTTYTDTSATTANTDYVYRVSARNDAGLGESSLPAYVTTAKY